ncbi:pyridoxal phosphate-dependent transferase [Xylogone sp. PMI_703]|nr:pyridoxal phosphate-dependent transferase [Xylogone sp. PMI_703]
MSSFDVTAARGQFPALRQSQVYFDNAGGSQTLGTVIEAIRDYLSGTNVQLGATYNVGKLSTTKYDEGYAAAAKYINASADEIVLGASTTQLFRNLSYSLEFPAGSELVVSAIDHEANIASWVSLAARQNLTIKWWKPKTRENPKLQAEDLKELLSEKTKLVTCTHASNILGTIHDIKAIAAVVHTVPGALLCVDAVAYAPHRRIDVKDLDVDFYAFSWYKVYGPHISMLYASPAGLSQVHSLGHYFNPSATLSQKLGLAGSSYELVAAMPAILSYLPPSDLARWASIQKQEEALQGAVLDYLNSRPDVTICGEKDADGNKRVSTISFVINGKKSQDVVESVDKLSEGNMGIRWGAFYSNRLVEQVLGLDGYDGIIRVSMVHYNTLDEVKQLLALFDQVLGK